MCNTLTLPSLKTGLSRKHSRTTNEGLHEVLVEGIITPSVMDLNLLTGNIMRNNFTTFNPEFMGRKKHSNF